MEVHIHSFLISGPGRCRPTFSQGKSRGPSTHWIWGCVGPTAALDVLGKRNPLATSGIWTWVHPASSIATTLPELSLLQQSLTCYNRQEVTTLLCNVRVLIRRWYRTVTVPLYFRDQRHHSHCSLQNSRTFHSVTCSLVHRISHNTDDGNWKFGQQYICSRRLSSIAFRQTPIVQYNQ
jgi:hypothetical protein